MSPFEQEKDTFLTQLENENFQFETTLTFIEQHYTYTASAFSNGSVLNSVNENQGSCKVFALAQLLQLSQLQTLKCFGQHYRDVLATPEVNNHHNLRRVLKEGSGNITFETFPLLNKVSL